MQHLILTPDEKIVMRGRADKQAMCGLFWIFLIVGVLFGLFPLPIFLMYWLSVKRVAWYVTNKRLVQTKASWIAPVVETEEIRWSNVGEIRAKKGALLDSIFGTANLLISDTGVNSIELKFVGKPDEVRRAISEQMHSA